MNAVEKNRIKRASKAVWGATPAGWTFGQGYEKGTKEFFESVLNKRFSYECDWLDEIVEFKRFKSKKVLEIGCGAGYDAYQFCKHGAVYTGIDITPDNPVIAQKHLSYYGYQAHIQEMDVEQLSWQNQFDYVYSFGVLHHTPDIQKAVRNIYNSLKVGGEAQIIVYYKYSIFYALHVVLCDWILRLKFLKISLKDRRSKIEHTASSELPLVNVYSKYQLKKILKNAGFTIITTGIRKLVLEELPDIPVVRGFYKFIPASVLQKLSHYFGWYVSVRAIK